MTVSEPKTWPSLSPEMAIPKLPMATPATSASRSPARPPPSSATRETSTTERTARPMPARTIAAGTPFEDDPADDRDDRRQDARDRRDDAHPTDRQPAIQGRDADATERRRRRGTAAGPSRRAWTHRRSRAMPNAMAMPTDCDSRTTPNTGARRLVSPPPKSPAPQAAAAASPSATVAVPAGRASIRRRLRSGRSHRRASDGSSTPSSTAVGPGSSTTASAALSYRSDVVR